MEAFEILGWPGQGPRERPLERPEPKALAHPVPQEAQSEVPQWSELAFPLLLVMAWFALLAALLAGNGSADGLWAAEDIHWPHQVYLRPKKMRGGDRVSMQVQHYLCWPG